MNEIKSEVEKLQSIINGYTCSGFEARISYDSQDKWHFSVVYVEDESFMSSGANYENPADCVKALMLEQESLVAKVKQMLQNELIKINGGLDA